MLRNNTRLILAVVLATVVAADGVRAHETDQFTVPAGKTQADLGQYFTDFYYDALTDAVNRLNQKIRNAESRGATGSQLDRFMSPDTIALTTRRAFPPTISLIDDIERILDRSAVRNRFPGRVVKHKEFNCIYSGSSFILDPRQVFKLWRSSTIRIGDTYLGIDKLGHFIAKGHISYEKYRIAIKKGVPHEQAVNEVIELGTGGDFWYSEKRMVGFLSSGTYSNADLVADWVGFKFYHNLTEPERFCGELRGPMIIREGNELRLAPYVRRDSDFVTVLFTDHYDESLNVCLYESGMRKAIRKAVVKRGDEVLEWHADRNGNRQTKMHFDDMLEGFRTYYGESFGYDGDSDDLITIGNTLFEELPADAAIDARSPRGETPLHQAAARGDLGRMQHLLDAGADPNVEVRSSERYSSMWGNTPLHSAAQYGQLDAAQLLVERGATIDHRNERGATPLHFAIEHSQIAAFLVAQGADVDARDHRGGTPLLWAARYPYAETAYILVSNGADVSATDGQGRAPLHNAAEFDNASVAEILIAQQADVNQVTGLGVTPLHVAAARNARGVTAALISAGANVDAADDFGWTPVHSAAAKGQPDILEALAAAGARLDATDCNGTTALHLTARSGYSELVRELIARGGDVNAANDFGATALHEAAGYGDRLTTDILLASGANPYARDHLGMTPRQYAARNNNQKVEQRLALARPVQARLDVPADSLAGDQGLE